MIDGAGIEHAKVSRGRNGVRATAAREQVRRAGGWAMSYITRPHIKSERLKDVLAFLVALALTLFIKFM
jgi:hypothetical protein